MGASLQPQGRGGRDREDGTERSEGREVGVGAFRQPLAAAPSTFLILPIFLSAFSPICALHPSIPWNRGTSLLFSGERSHPIVFAEPPQNARIRGEPRRADGLGVGEVNGVIAADAHRARQFQCSAEEIERRREQPHAQPIEAFETCRRPVRVACRLEARERAVQLEAKKVRPDQ